MPELFHFLQPLWFLALIPMALLLWWLPRAQRDNSQWQRACESHLLPYLLNKPVQAFAQVPLWLLAVGWFIAVVALADPVWQKQPQPVFRNQHAAVVVLDLSRSMLSGDLTPSRLERARYKLAEILKRRTDGQTGLVVFAGDAFTVSPLTNDARTIQALLTPLNPDLMPVQGSRADLGIQQAVKLLKQAGVPHGDILLLTDGYSDSRALDVAADLNRQGYRLSVLGVGSEQPAPIPAKQGGFVRDSQGKLVMPTLNVTRLQKLANQGGGRYHTITVNDSDLSDVLPSLKSMDAPMQATNELTDRWQSHGPWFLLFLLPLAALGFRRGWLLMLPLAMLLTLGAIPQPAMAAGWNDLWQRRDQQADQALRSGDVARARQLAEQPLRRGEAAYRAGDYADALNAFNASDSAEGHYNRGNALAQLGRYQDAIKAYDQALTKQPEMADALHNKQELEKLLKQQQKQQQTDNKNGDGKDNKQQQTDNKNGDGKDNKQQQADNKNGDGNDNNQQQADNKNANDNKQQQDENKNADGNDNSTQQAENNHPADTGSDQQQAEAQAQQPAAASADSPQDTASQEQQLADERWLRRIPDDPGGLLRRKFLYQYSQRGGKQSTAQQDW